MVEIYEALPPGSLPAWQITQRHVATADGSNGYSYGPWSRISEYYRPSVRDVGTWTAGSDYEEGDKCRVRRIDATDAGTLAAWDEYLCVLDHLGASAATRPGSQGGAWRRYWVEYREGARLTAAPAPIDADPADPPAEAAEPAYRHRVAMDRPMPGVAGEAHQPDRPGEYKFGRRDYAAPDGSGAVDLVWTPIGNAWVSLRTTANATLGLSRVDADGRDQTAFYDAVRPGDLFHLFVRARWWIQWTVASAHRSTDGDRVVLGVAPTALDGRDAGEIVPSGRVEFRWARAAPTVRTPGESGAP